MATYSTSFPGADENPLSQGGAFVSITGEASSIGDLRKISNGVAGTIADSNAMVLASGVLTPAGKEQKASLRVLNHINGGASPLCNVRNGSTSGHSAFQVFWSDSTAEFIVRQHFDGWSYYTQLAAIAGTFAADDVLGLETEDEGVTDTLTVRVLKNGVQAGSDISAPYPAATSAGTVGLFVHGQEAASSPVATDFSGGDFGDTVAPSFTESPKAVNVTNTGYGVRLTADENCTARYVVKATQPSNAEFDASTETASVTAGVPATITHTG